MKNQKRKIILCGEYAERRVAFEEIAHTASCDMVKILTEDDEAGVHGQYDWMDFRYPGYEGHRQSLTEREINGKTVTCDVHDITLEDGTEWEVVFDISMFFGKGISKTEKYAGPEYCDIPALTEELETLEAEYEGSSDNDMSDEEYTANIEKIMAADKLRHDAYLEKLKPLALENPEYPYLMVKYAAELVESIDMHDTLNEGKTHLDHLKTIMEENSGQNELIALYGRALYHFAKFFGRMEPQDTKSRTEYTETIYELWKQYPEVTELLKTYSFALELLSFDLTNDEDKNACLAKIHAIAEEYLD